jgi:hypothetical protein
MMCGILKVHWNVEYSEHICVGLSYIDMHLAEEYFKYSAAHV